MSTIISKPETIKALAKELAADPDVLFRLSSSTDLEVSGFLNDKPEVMELLRFIKEVDFNRKQLKQLLVAAKNIHTECNHENSLITSHDKSGIQAKENGNLKICTKARKRTGTFRFCA